LLETFKEAVPLLDIVVDDGGHLPIQHRTSLEDLLPHLRPVGVYLCEDVTGVDNEFASYACELTNKLNAFENVIGNIDNNERRLVLGNSEFQSVIHSIHFYRALSLYGCCYETREVAALVAANDETTYLDLSDAKHFDVSEVFAEHGLKFSKPLRQG
jgi:hypothetical protein